MFTYEMIYLDAIEYAHFVWLHFLDCWFRRGKPLLGQTGSLDAFCRDLAGESDLLPDSPVLNSLSR